MTIEQARYIVKIAQLGTIQQAAKSLFVSQSAISQSLSTIESDLGMQIFKRTRSGCELTNFGMEICRICQQIVINVDAIEAFPRMRVSQDSGNVSVFIANYGLYSYIPQVISMFRKTYPNFELTINEMDYQDMLSALDKNICDFGVAIVLEPVYKELKKKYDCHILSESYLTAGVSYKSALAGRSALTPEQLKGNLLALSNTSFAQSLWKILPCFSTKDVLFYSNNLTLIHSAITKELAVGIFTDLSPHYNKSLFQNTIVTVPLIVDGRRPASYFISILPKNSELKKPARDLFEVWMKYAEFAPLSHETNHELLSFPQV